MAQSPASNLRSLKKKLIRDQNELREKKRPQEILSREGLLNKNTPGNVYPNSNELYKNEGHMIVGPKGERNNNSVTNTIGTYFPDLLATTGDDSSVLKENNYVTNDKTLLSALLDETNSGLGNGQISKNEVQEKAPYNTKQIMFDLGAALKEPPNTELDPDVDNLDKANDCVKLLHGKVYTNRSADAIKFDSFKFAYEEMNGKKERTAYLKAFVETVADYYSDLIDLKGIHNFEDQNTVAYLVQITGPSPFSLKSVSLSRLSHMVGKGDRRGTEEVHNIYLRALAEGFDKIISSKEKDATSLGTDIYQSILSSGAYTAFLKTRK